MRHSQSRRGWYLWWVAILASIVWCAVLLFLLGLLVNPSSEPDPASMGDDTPVIEEPTATATVARSEMPTIAIPPTLMPTPVLTVASTSTPAPTRREFLEPTKAPYVFPNPIYIPPTPRERSTPTRSK